MPEHLPVAARQPPESSGRRSFFYTVFGGLVAALAGWLSAARSGDIVAPGEAEPTPAPDPRIAFLESEVTRLAEQLGRAGGGQPLAELEGEYNERVVFNKRELTVANPEGVLVNLVATRGHVGFRFYKDFGFGNETVDSPWSIFIEGLEGYQGLAFLRDWRFTAALWDEDGKLLLGRLHPHPPANEPAGARLHVRGTVDEVQTLVDASPGQTADVFRVRGQDQTSDMAVNSAGNLVVGSSEAPRQVILHDAQDGTAHALGVVNGRLVLTPA